MTILQTDPLKQRQSCFHCAFRSTERKTVPEESTKKVEWLSTIWQNSAENSQNKRWGRHHDITDS